LVLVDFAFLVSIRNDGKRVLRDTNDHDTMSFHRVGEAEVLAKICHSLLVRVDSGPDCAVSETMCCEEHILHTRRAVQDPVAGGAFEGFVCAENDRVRGVGKSGNIRMDPH